MGLLLFPPSLGVPVLSQPHFSFPFCAWKSIPPVLPHLVEPGCAGREFRDLLAPGFGIFLHFSRLLSFGHSFGRLNSLQTWLQLLFVTDFIPSIAFLVLEAETRMFPTVDGSSASVWDSLLAPQLLSHPPSIKDLSPFPPGDPRESRSKEGSREGLWTCPGTVPGAVGGSVFQPLREDP